MPEPKGRDESLTSALKAIAEEDASLGASAAVRERLLAEVRVGRRRVHRRHVVAIYGVAAALVLAVAVPVWRVAHRPRTDITAVRLDTPVRPSSDDTTAVFLPLGYSNLPVTGVQVVRLEVPRTALTTFGVAPADIVNGSSAGTVLADVLVGEDGVARAVRFVKTTRQEPKP